MQRRHPGQGFAPAAHVDGGAACVAVGEGLPRQRGPLPRGLAEAVGLLARLRPRRSPPVTPTREQLGALARNAAARAARERDAYRTLRLGAPPR
jgi:hypothetical protein